MHANLMWGMILLFIGTALATLDWEIFRLVFHVRLLQGGFYFIYKFILDIAGLLAFSALCVAIYIRYIKNRAASGAMVMANSILTTTCLSRVRFSSW